MSLREELELAMASISQAKASPISAQVDRARDLSLFFIRNNGQALLDALDAEAKWKEMTDQARQIQHRHLDRHEGDVYHAMQSLASKFGHRWNAPLTEAIDAAIKGDG